MSYFNVTKYTLGTYGLFPIINLSFSAFGMNKGHSHYWEIQRSRQDEPRPSNWPCEALFKLLLIHFPLAPTPTTTAKQWLRWTASSLPLLSWHVHSGGRAPGRLYLPPCGARCLWHRGSTGMCGLPKPIPAVWCKHQWGYCQGRPSVDVDNCRCDERGRFLSRAPSTWPWTRPNAAPDNEENMPGRDENVSASVVPLSLSVRQDFLVAGKSTAEEISISSLPPRLSRLGCFDLTGHVEARDQAGNISLKSYSR